MGTSTHLVPSRIVSQHVARCRPVFETAALNYRESNPAYRRSRPTFCIPQNRKCGRQNTVSASDLAAAQRVADTIERVAATVSRWPTFCAPIVRGA